MMKDNAVCLMQCAGAHPSAAAGITLQLLLMLGKLYVGVLVFADKTFFQ
jgi:hypothetical protein